MSARHLLTTLVGLAAAILVSLAMAGCAADDPFTVEAEFSRTFNLFEGSKVRVLGVEVGTIEEVEIGPGRQTVRVAMQIHDPDVELPADVNAFVEFDSLLGERHVNFHPPYDGGPTLESGAVIPMERTGVPSEFDEVLESFNEFLAGMPPEEVARLVTNAADVLDGRGDELGRTLEDVATAVEVLRDNDEQVVSLVRRLADLNATLGTRDDEIQRIIVDWDTVLGALVDERDALDRALGGVGRMSEELGGLLAANRATLEQDVQTVTRVGRTAVRNLEEIDLLLLGQSELYRHAERVMDRERNWLPLINHADGLAPVLADRLGNRLARACAELDITECADTGFWDDQLPDGLCIPGVFNCPPEQEPDQDDPGAVVPMAQALRDVVDRVPELGEQLADAREQREQDDGLNRLLRSGDRRGAETGTTDAEPIEEERRPGDGQVLDGWLPQVGGR